MTVVDSSFRLRSRDSVSGPKFSIIFGVVAAIIVAGCLLLGFFLPRYRRKHRRRPSSVRYNTELQDQYPSHPALLRGFRKQPSGNLRQYNPRTQTPFPNTPPPGDPVSLLSVTPHKQRVNPAVSVGGFGDMLTPARDRLPSRRGFTDNRNRQHSTSGQRQQLASHFDVDDILPVPEPVLRPRSAGRAPTLARHLSRFPMPRSGSDGSGNLAHPRKLFDDLEQRYSKSTTGTSMGTPSPLPLSTHNQKFLASQTRFLQPSQEAVETSTNKAGDCADNFAITDELRRMRPDDVLQTEWPGLSRADTITRPKTPVAEVRILYDGKPGINVMKRRETSRSVTLSSIDLPTNSPLSDDAGQSTPPTSPVLPRDISASIKRLGNTPAAARVTPTPDRAWSRATTSSSMALPAVDRLERMDTIIEGQWDGARAQHQSRPSRPQRPRPARLNLTFPTRTSSLVRSGQRHSMSSLSNILLPLTRSKRPSVQSSVYSRDTHGVSIVRSPSSPEFGDKIARDQREDSVVKTVQAKASSLDLLRHKIDNWDLHTAYLDFSTSPSSTLKRALSDFGPYSPTFPAPRPASAEGAANTTHHNENSTVPKICIGRASDDIFRDPSPNVESGHVLKRVLDMEVAESVANLARRPSRGTAPGGADWI
jgi:hypothetical protein